MHMADPVASRADRLREIAFLDVHVKEIGQHLHTPRLQALEKFDRRRDTVEEIGLVAIEEFVEQRLAGRRAVIPEILEPFREPRQGLVASYVAFDLALHRTDDCR